MLVTITAGDAVHSVIQAQAECAAVICYCYLLLACPSQRFQVLGCKLYAVTILHSSARQTQCTVLRW
jgi:hypothetical protein